MITSLSKRQLAFVLKIKQTEAEDKMLYAFAKHKGVYDPDGYPPIPDDFDCPDQIKIELLTKYLNLPDLQESVNDIHNNFFTRSTTKGWIMEYPQKVIDAKTEKGEPCYIIHLPPAMRSLVREDIQEEIIKAWENRYHVKDLKFAV